MVQFSCENSKPFWSRRSENLALQFHISFIMTLDFKMRQILLQNPTATLLQNATDVYYKMRQVFYYKMRQFYNKM